MFISTFLIYPNNSKLLKSYFDIKSFKISQSKQALKKKSGNASQLIPV